MTDESKPFWKEEDRWGNREYFVAGDPLPFTSVTTWMSKGEPKTGIDFIKRKKGAECAIDDWKTVIAPLVKAGARDQAVDYIMDAANREWQGSLDLGNTVHLVAEAIGNDWPLPDYIGMIANPIIELLDDESAETADDVRQRVTAELTPRVMAVRNFFEDWRPKMVYTEMTVFNRTLNYAGTFDGIMEVEVNGKAFRFLIDWKTTKPGRQGHGIYPSTACQLAAYRHAEFAFDNNGAQIPVPEVDGCYGVNILKGKYVVVPANCTADRKCLAFRKFRAAQEVAGLVKHGAKELLGNPVAPPIRRLVEA